MKRLALSILLVAIALTGTALAQDTAGLVVNADESLGTISPYVYGANFGIQSAIPVDLISQAQNAGVHYLRRGGGFSDERPLLNGDIDLFMGTIRIVGAEPAITVRLHESTPEASAANVEYANIKKGYNIRYWSIGNEPSLFAGLFQMEYTTEMYNREWRAHAEAMLAVDPNIILVGPDIHQYPGIPEQNLKDSTGLDWMEEFLKVNGDLVGVVSFHRYPFPHDKANPAITMDDLRLNSREWDDHIIPSLREVIQRTTGRDIPIAVTEVNSSWANNVAGEASMDSHYNGIWYGDVLGRLIRQRVTIAAYWDFQRRHQSWGLIGGDSVRPTYYTFQMYKQFGTEALMTASTIPDVNVYAARREDGSLTVMVVNMTLEPATAPLTLNGFTPGAEAEVWRFDPEHNAELLGTEPFTGEVTLLGQSLTLFIIPAA
jgi:hypothetical protein